MTKCINLLSQCRALITHSSGLCCHPLEDSGVCGFSCLFVCLLLCVLGLVVGEPASKALAVAAVSVQVEHKAVNDGCCAVRPSAVGAFLEEESLPRQFDDCRLRRGERRGPLLPDAPSLEVTRP